ELLQVRMLSFFLGSISNFLAIPIALFGLALGSLFCHFIYRGDPHRLVSLFLLLVFPVLAAVLIAFFAVANSFYPEIHVAFCQPGKNAVRLLVYSGLFLPPYFLFGALLSSFFSLHAARIGRLYFFDLAGAALGCLAVPLLFTYTDLPAVIFTLLLFSMMLIPLSRLPHSTVAFGIAVVAIAVIQALAFSGAIFREQPDAPTLARSLMKPGTLTLHEEVRVRWNDIARTSLVRAFPVSGSTQGHPSFVVVQDDGLSNVRVKSYDPKVTRKQAKAATELWHAMPFALGIRPKNILVMFAGIGRDMVYLDALAERKARITGVELNPLVIDFANEPILRSFRLREFFSRPEIELVAREGRDFLNNSNEKYELIFVATNGSVHATRTGHTRKYLDTYEAMSAYLDHLDPDGVLFFWNQPIEHKLVSFRRLFAKRNLGDLGSAMYAYGSPLKDSIRSLLVKPSGLIEVEVKALEAARKSKKKVPLLYSPGGGGAARFASIIDGKTVPNLSDDPLTDDNPFAHKVELSKFELFPGAGTLKDSKYSSDWIKVFTVLVFAFVSLIVIVALRFLGKPDRRLPFLWFTYFFVSGLGYMGVEIGLIAKIELFMGNPLYAIAVILAIFLLANACGAMLQDRYGIMRGWKSLLVYTTVAVAWTVAAATVCNSFLLSVPLPIKLLFVVVAVAPAGLCLGMYFPLGVATLVRGGRPAAVPAAYAIATLSSVVGSAFSMTAIVNVGFNTAIGIGAACYVAVAFVFVTARRFAR
ncbi:MAG TPA: hypothetical protein VM285_14935, partial [Polyangia bacterium]|nr:hypothetical protein [Polyangia bacterium]